MQPHTSRSLGRPRLFEPGEQQSFHLYLTIPHADWLRRQSHVLRVSKSEIIRRLIKQEIDRVQD